ncbi:MAG: hypothetical protein R6V72_02275 [Cyclobacterium sp.]|uniref:hypothetical protein n=1 Tax=unclassified Cyclobacterium TaxID=2615055 RepID=UPI0013D09404|nr:hypothetical protein [Cyclobacterium sp. SYSU L10401]
MKTVILALLLLGLGQVSSAKDSPEKTFLIIFNEAELKRIQSSPAKVELNFLKTFETKAYGGNSERALMVTVPFADWTVCEMGSMVVKITDSKEVPLEDIAFRIIDMDECQENFKALLSKTEDQKQKKKIATIKLTL